MTLGALTYGLLLQRKAFEEACTKLEAKAKQEIQKHFLDSNSEFRKISDNLLQYTCGRRAEVIQTRRDTYKCPNKVLNDVLHEIPPSDTHLFCEEKLNEAIKEQGGAYKFFPKKAIQLKQTKKPFKGNSSTKNRYPQQNNFKQNKKQHRNFRTSWKQDYTNKPSKTNQPAERKP